jgi:hypothetical protein
VVVGEETFPSDEKSSLMVEVPKPSDITNVFGLNNPQHMYTKMMVELTNLQTALSVWTKNEPYPEPLFIAFNLAVTAWHMSDWLWMSSRKNREMLARKYSIAYNETPSGIDSGLGRFQEAVAKENRALYACREIANASKHMRRKKHDPEIKALVEWHPVIEAVGHAKVGDLVMSLSIFDGEKKWDASRFFIDAIGHLSCTRFRRHRVRCFMEQEVCHGETAVYAGVQA